MPELATYVIRRMQRSGYLMKAVHQALGDLKRLDLTAILDLAIQDASEALVACQQVVATRRQKRMLRARLDLMAISRAGNPALSRLAKRVAKEVRI